VLLSLGVTSAKQDRHLSYAIYWRDTPNEEPELTDQVLVANPPEVTDEDLEIYPTIVLNKAWWICYRDELIQDVVDNALYQKPNIRHQDLLLALRYYSHHDCFMDLA
jgi:hypothetical protein